jgi:hypothetical protein
VQLEQASILRQEVHPTSDDSLRSLRRFASQGSRQRREGMSKYDIGLLERDIVSLQKTKDAQEAR